MIRATGATIPSVPATRPTHPLIRHDDKSSAWGENALSDYLPLTKSFDPFWGERYD